MRKPITVVLMLFVAIGFSQLAQAAPQADHFKAVGPDKSQVREDSLFSPNDFEAATASHPDPNGLTLFSLCRRAPFTSTTLYSSIAGTNVDAVVNDTTFTLVDGTECYEPQNEQNIVVNPTNSQNIVTSANDYRYGFQALIYRSTDGGNTFSDILLPGWDSFSGANGLFKHVQAGGDPALAFATDGTLYYSALVYDFSFANRTPSGVAVASSRDGGANWSKPVMVHYEDANNFFNDKEWIAAGAGGKVYVTWTLFKSNKPHGYISSNIVEAVSHDYGVTWSSPIAVSDSAHPFDQGSSPAVAPDGTVYVAYEGNQASDVTKDQIVLARSTDGGRTFTNIELGRVYDDIGCYPLNVAQGRQRLTFEQFRVSSFPSLAIDPSTGGLAIAWSDDQNNPGCAAGAASFSGVTNNQVKLVTSANGRTWTAAAQITSGKDKVYPAVGANHGRVVVGYYTRDYSPVPTATDHSCQRGFLSTTDPGYPASTTVYYTDLAPVCLDYAFSSSTDGYVSETRVSTQSSNPYIEFSGSFIGDYTGVAVDSAGGAHTVWTDFRGLPGVTTPNQDTVVGNVH
ncbi:MAG TPA: sialidase family protein [Steroidobacteraceae bacterium]|nr:sialidase family protein [Steroidobacteraceae bacterium]